MYDTVSNRQRIVGRKATHRIVLQVQHADKSIRIAFLPITFHAPSHPLLLLPKQHIRQLAYLDILRHGLGPSFRRLDGVVGRRGG